MVYRRVDKWCTEEFIHRWCTEVNIVNAIESLQMTETNGKRRFPDVEDEFNHVKSIDVFSRLMSSQKRPRISQGTDSNEDDVNSTKHKDQSDSESDSESESDTGSEDDTEDDTLPASAGILERLQLKNFMCHDSFELDLGPRLNFIVGRNGSGKSAIITGIMVGLGAKAAHTNRGKGLTDLIKDGRNTARIILTFKNKGNDAYEPEKYGDQIIIERKLVRIGGGSNYTVKDSENKVISHKKLLIDDILLRFNIRIDNPLGFLSQDKAREFLTSTSDEDKYNYFLRGVSFLDIIENYQAMMDHLSEISGKLQLSLEAKNRIEQRFNESIRKYQQFQKSSDLREKAYKLQGKVYWFNVSKIELGLKRCTDNILRCEAEIEALLSTKTEHETNSIRATEKIQQINEEVAQLKVPLDEVGTKIKNNNGDTIALKGRREGLRNEIETNNETITQCQHDIQGLEQEIVKEREKIDALNGGTMEELKLKLNDLKIELETLKQQKSKLTMRISTFDETSTIKQQVNLKIREIQEEQTNIRETDDRINTLKASKRDKYVAWEKGMKEFVERINNIQDWHVKPLGPIGTYISVKPEYREWKDLLNTVLTRTLDSFLVYDEHDRRILVKLMKELRINKNIIVRRFEKFNYQQGMPSGHITIVDMLEVFDENIIYTLVDLHSIEKSVITDDNRKANQMVLENNVLNVFSRFTKNSGQRATGNKDRFNVDPIFYNMKVHKLAGRSSVADIDQEIAKEQRLRQESSEEVARLKKELRDLQVTGEREKEELYNQSEQVGRQITSLTKEIDNLEMGLDEANINLKFDSLGARIDEKKQQVIRIEGVLISLGEDLKRVLEDIKDKAQERKELITENNQLSQSIKQLETEKESLSVNLVSMDNMIAKAQHQVKTLHKSIEEYRAKITSYQQKLEDNQTKAEAICEREAVSITSEDTAQTIQIEYKDTQKAIEEVDKMVGIRYEDIQQQVIKDEEQLRTATETFNNLHEIYQDLSLDIKQRYKAFQVYANATITEVSRLFESALEVRKYSGKLKIDTEKKRIQMLVSPKGSEEIRTVDSLSGGEKSFTQVAFLLSIWKVMDSKIRGLDEFDVFMDSVNRKVSMDLLLNELETVPKSQTIFITPQDITSFTKLDANDVKIHQMASPRED